MSSRTAFVVFIISQDKIQNLCCRNWLQPTLSIYVIVCNYTKKFCINNQPFVIILFVLLLVQSDLQFFLICLVYGPISMVNHKFLQRTAIMAAQKHYLTLKQRSSSLTSSPSLAKKFSSRAVVIPSLVKCNPAQIFTISLRHLKYPRINRFIHINGFYRTRH